MKGRAKGQVPSAKILLGAWSLELGTVVELDLVKRSKGARRMPRRGQARKDVASCDKPGGAARGL